MFAQAKLAEERRIAAAKLQLEKIDTPAKSTDATEPSENISQTNKCVTQENTTVDSNDKQSVEKDDVVLKTEGKVKNNAVISESENREMKDLVDKNEEKVDDEVDKEVKAEITDKAEVMDTSNTANNQEEK